LKPILSRFCEIYIPEPVYKGKTINLYKYNLETIFKLSSVKNTRIEWVKKEIQKMITPDITESALFTFILKLYEKGYSALDLIKIIEDGFSLTSDKELMTEEKKYELLVAFNKIKREIRNEKIMMLFIINFAFLDREIQMENIAFL